MSSQNLDTVMTKTTAEGMTRTGLALIPSILIGLVAIVSYFQPAPDFTHQAGFESLYYNALLILGLYIVAIVGVHAFQVHHFMFVLRMYRELLRSDDGTLVWSNTSDGNDHSLIYNNGILTMTVTKKDGTTFRKKQETVSTLDEWRKAFADVGPTWNQSDVHDDPPRFRATRTVAVASTGEVTTWIVDHFDEGGSYVIADNFKVAVCSY